MKATIKTISGFLRKNHHALLLPGAISMVAAIIILSLVYLLASGQKITLKYTPLINATAQIRYHTTNAYQQLERLLEGRQASGIEVIWTELNKADNYTVLMLEGGYFDERHYIPVENPDIRAHIQSIRRMLTRITTLGEQRYHDSLLKKNEASTTRYFKELYGVFISTTFYIEARMQQNLTTGLQQFEQRSNFLLVMILILAGGLFGLLRRILGNNLQQLEEIKQADDLIRRKNTRLEQLAHFDHLTGLPNRPLFNDRTRQAILHAQRENYSVVILYIDLDHFKSINDSMGHEAGDLLLIELSKRLAHAIRKEDTVSRLSGDEFAILLANIPDPRTAAETAQHIAEKILKTLKKPVTIADNKVTLSASIGIAVFPEDGTHIEQLLRAADSAMYHAKTSGKDNFQFHTLRRSHKMKHRIACEQDLLYSLENDLLLLHYQPQWNLRTMELVGLEVLLRCNHADFGLMLPKEFIRIAERSTLITRLEFWVLENACRHFSSWLEAGINPAKLSLNVSSRVFSRPDYCNRLIATLRKHRIPPSRIELEVTEPLLKGDSPHIQITLQQLKRHGIHLAVSDVGSGFSLFETYDDLPVSAIKINRDQIARLGSDKISNAILSHLLKLGEIMDFRIIAEGIESDYQLAYLQNQGCNYGQGFLLGKPASHEATTQLLQARLPRNVTPLKPRNIPHVSQSISSR